MTSSPSLLVRAFFLPSLKTELEPLQFPSMMEVVMCPPPSPLPLFLHGIGKNDALSPHEEPLFPPKLL